ncbi:MAG: hypothetical protein ACOY0T_22890 [Myxococcota bacterium]
MAQKIFYFHVPAVLFGVFVSVIACGLASAAYLFGATERRNAVAKGSAECFAASSGAHRSDPRKTNPPAEDERALPPGRLRIAVRIRSEISPREVVSAS